MKITNTNWFIVLLVCLLATGNIASAQNITSNQSGTGFTFTRNLTVGVTGSDVSALQQFLIDTGFLKTVAPTAYFGPLTRTALGEWQKVADINPNVGFFGPLSRARMNGIFHSVPQDAIAVPGIVVPTTTPAATTSVPVATQSTNGSPARLRIPSLNVDAGFQFNGLKSDGTMEIPDNITDIGWYTGSPRPGEKGNAIVTGHVAQIRRSVVTKPGVFFNLSQLRQGDTLFVQNDKGVTTTFVVRESRLYDPNADATDVFTSKDDRAHLVLITCEGTWNQDLLSYSQRLVVFADAAQ